MERESARIALSPSPMSGDESPSNLEAPALDRHGRERGLRLPREHEAASARLDPVFRRGEGLWNATIPDSEDDVGAVR